MTDEERREKLVSAAATGLVLTLIGGALLGGLAVGPDARREEAPTLVTLIAAKPPAPHPRERPRHPSPAPKASAPPAPRARAAAIVAPKPPLPILRPPPLPAALVAGIGAATNSGASTFGDGQGAGGAGDGFGGGYGDGDDGQPPRQTGGRLRYGDLPADRRASGITATVGVRYSVERNGRVGTCLITRSSGFPDVDAVTCRLIAERFRFRPARDSGGRPVQSWIIENHSFIVDRLFGHDPDEDGPRG